ncbi:MAG: hypothetical protein J6Q94_02720 [Clostridia bacterium]|nr:hypothetical protein [Clostridia bacterium]
MIKKAVIASGLSDDVRTYLIKSGFDIVKFQNNPDVDIRVAHHADLSFFFDGKDTLFIANEMAEYYDRLNKYCKNIVVLNKKLRSDYPGDVLLNCVCTGKHFICNPETVSTEIIAKMYKAGYNIINVKQGYTKCSVVPVNDNAIITDDESVYKECIKSGLDVLKISKGSVELPGFEYGFIGGATGKTAHDEIIFNGDITKHPDYKNIDLFLKKYNVRYVYFSGNLEDIGSIISIGGL